MPRKNEVNQIERKEFIERKSMELIKSGNFNSFHDVYEFIADNHLYCCVTTIYRAINETKEVKKVVTLFNPITQLKLF